MGFDVEVLIISAFPEKRVMPRMKTRLRRKEKFGMQFKMDSWFVRLKRLEKPVNIRGSHEQRKKQRIEHHSCLQWTLLSKKRWK